MIPETDKLVCTDCNAHIRQAEVLKAPNPFAPEFELHGCPQCKDVRFLRGCCDEPGCWAEDTMGTPTTNGPYRRTCWEHRPAELRCTPIL